MTLIENCIDGENPLYDWCMDHYNDNNQCSKLCYNTNNLDLLDFIDEEIRNVMENPDELNKNINYYRRSNTDLKKFINNSNLLTNKRKYEISQKQEKETMNTIIILSILLIVGICFGIYCIYHYFVIPKK